jgi:PAS domain S-box-containing protein
MPDDITRAQALGLPGNLDWNDGAARQHLIRLEQVIRAIASPVIVTDKEGVTVWVNAAFTQTTGYEMDEAVGITPGQLLQGPDTDRREAARVGAALRSRRSVAAELINYAKDGRRYWIGMKIHPLLASNGEFDGFMAIEADITDRHERQREMEQLTRRFRMATRAARVGVFERDAHWEITWWSPMMWEIFGQHPASFKPSNESWLGLIHPEDRERIREQLASLGECLSTSTFDFQYRVIRPDGELRHIKSIGAPADIEEGVVSCFAGVTLDITERIEGEEREQALQRLLREHSHQAGMAEIATGVLHNVGNVLNSLGIANATARRELKALRLERLEQATGLLLSNRDTLPAFLSEHERGRHLPDYLPALASQLVTNVRAIQAELETTQQLLHHLGDIVSAQQELAHTGGRRELIHLHELLETALLVHASELAQIEIVRYYGQLPPIMVDRHTLLQILVNLLSNAESQ